MHHIIRKYLVHISGGPGRGMLRKLYIDVNYYDKASVDLYSDCMSMAVKEDPDNRNGSVEYGKDGNL